MKRIILYGALTIICALVLTSAVTGQSPTRIFGTNTTTGAAEPISATSGALHVSINGGAPTGLTSITFATGGAVRTGTTAGDTVSISAYDVNGTAYVPLLTGTANNEVTLTLPASIGLTIADGAPATTTSKLYQAAGTLTWGGPISGTTLTASTGIDATTVLASQTTENVEVNAALTSDSTFLTGTNITYSGGRGSSVAKLTGNYSGVNGGFHALYGIANVTGTQTDASAGIVGGKLVINTTVAQTAGNFTAIQGIAKFNHASAKAANAAPFVGLEGVVTQSTAGQIGTAIGVSAAYHIPADAAAYDAGAVWRGLQITLDNASAVAPSEETGLAIWNMTGTQTNAVKIIKSAGGFTQDIVLQNGETISNAVDGTIALTGDALVSGAATVGLIASQSVIKLQGFNDASPFTVTLTVPDIAGDYTLVLPTTDGGANEFLKTDGSGNLSWAAGMTYPDAGIGVSTGSAWGTSLSSTAPTFTTSVGIATGAVAHPQALSVIGSLGLYNTYTATDYEGATLVSTTGAVTLSAVTLGTGADNRDIVLTPAGTGTIKIASVTNANITLNTTDGGDNGVLKLAGGGAYGVTRGASFSLYGNEYATGNAYGDILYYVGNGDAGSNKGDFFIKSGTGDLLSVYNAGHTVFGDIATQDVLKLLPVTSATRFTGILTVADLTTADKTYTFPDLTGQVALVGSAIQNGADFDATGFSVAGVAGIDKTCGGPVVSATFVKGILSAMVCTSEPQPTPAELLAMIADLRAELAALKARQ